jgi:hypothetical protein
MEPISQRKSEHRYTDRRCDACQRQTDGLSSLCRRHIKYRGKHGSVKVRRYTKSRDYLHLVKLARAYLKEHPPEQPILDSMARFLQPPDAIPRGSRARGRRERAALRQEMSRWSDPRYRKSHTHGTTKGDRGYFKYDYTPTGILAVLVGITAYIDEREGQGWPHSAEAIEKAHALIRLWRRPRSVRGGKEPYKVSATISPSTLRGLAARLREFSAVGVYCLITARAILAEYKANEAARIKRLPKTNTQEDMRRMYEAQQARAKLKQEAEQEEKRRQQPVLVFEDGGLIAITREEYERRHPKVVVPEPEPFDPGPRPINDGSCTAAAAIMTWCKDMERWQAHQRRQQGT